MSRPEHRVALGDVLERRFEPVPTSYWRVLVDGVWSRKSGGGPGHYVSLRAAKHHTEAALDFFYRKGFREINAVLREALGDDLVTLERLQKQAFRRWVDDIYESGRIRFEEVE